MQCPYITWRYIEEMQATDYTVKRFLSHCFDLLNRVSHAGKKWNQL